MYLMVPRVIIFRPEHTKRVLVPKVDFISAPGISENGVYRKGGPYALVTELCVMLFDRKRSRFRLSSVHPHSNIEEIKDNTGFEFDQPDFVPETLLPNEQRLLLLREKISKEIGKNYPKFIEDVFKDTT